MNLQDELDELREVVQALCDYVGRDRVSSLIVSSRKAKESAANKALEDAKKATNGTIADFADLTTYSNSAATIRNDIYQADAANAADTQGDRP